MRTLNSNVTLFLIFFGLSLGLVGSAEASFILLTNPGQFSGRESLLTFEGIQPFQNVTTYHGVGFQQVGAPPGTGLEGAFDPSPPREFGPPEGTIIQTLLGALPTTRAARDAQITFPGPINRLAFELETVTPGDILISLFSSGVQVELFAIPARGPGAYFFYGFETTELFDQAVLRGPGDSDRRIVMDNLRFEAGVPAPSTFLLLGSGMAGLAGITWRRSRRNSSQGRPGGAPRGALRRVPSCWGRYQRSRT